MTIRAVLFDLGNTLLEYTLHGRWPEFRRQRLEQLFPLICELCGQVDATPAEFADAMGGLLRDWEAERAGRSRHFAQRLRAALDAVGLKAEDGALDRLTDAFYVPIRACTSPYPETRDVLDCLRTLGIRLAIITNAPWDTPTRLLRGDVEHWGLAGFFDAFICSGGVPWRKPNPAFMLAAAEALGVPPSECIVVGDSLAHDIAGARAAGMRSAWINRDSQPLPADGPQPEWVVSSLVEVVQLVGGHSQR